MNLKRDEPLKSPDINNDVAEQQFVRIKEMIQKPYPKYRVEWQATNSLNSLPLYIYNAEGKRSRALPLVATEIASLNDKVVWRKLELGTLGFVQEPSE